MTTDQLARALFLVLIASYLLARLAATTTRLLALVT
jgi:hypothetical protein